MAIRLRYNICFVLPRSVKSSMSARVKIKVLNFKPLVEIFTRGFLYPWCIIYYQMKNKNKFQYIIGIDEVGRGPLAGPVAVGACLISVSKIKRLREEGFFVGIKDSKKLSEKKREEWLGKINEFKTKNGLDYSVSFVGNKIIDKKGISQCIKLAIKNSLKKLKAEPLKTMILLDGGFKAPDEFVHQKTIIKGDEKEPIISFASIVAKVARDRKMVEYSKKFPQYGFEIHKGYGTAFHIQKISQNGPSKLHRKSFCKNIINC